MHTRSIHKLLTCVVSCIPAIDFAPRAIGDVGYSTNDITLVPVAITPQVYLPACCAFHRLHINKMLTDSPSRSLHLSSMLLASKEADPIEDTSHTAKDWVEVVELRVRTLNDASTINCTVPREGVFAMQWFSPVVYR